MSDFIAANLHKKVDHLMDIFFGAGVASHPTIIEQINYLLFMRALSQNDDDLRRIGITDPNQLVFDDDLEKYRWDNLLTLNAEQLFIALEECFRKIPESTTNKTVRLVFRNAHIKLFDKPTLRTVVHEIDAFAKMMDEGEHAGKRDIFGDTYEYLLSKLAQAGTSGQFRTPRHIIEFLVAVVDPKKGETILDPAVGTAGFLVKAFEHLRNEYTSPEQIASGGAFDKLNSKEHTFLYEHTFSGFDSDEDMIKFGMMNLFLHGLQNARMVRQNTLTDTAGSRDKYDVILANPPFAGKVDRDSVAEELQMGTGATEVLFLNYIVRHLTDSGRMGVIVPEGVLFNSSGGHSKIRQQLIDNGLWCVVSLPPGIFNPYSGVKTSIIFLDKEIAQKQQFDRIIFLDINSDGYSLGSQRRHIGHSDLDNALVLLRECYKEIKEGNIRHSSQYYFPFQDPDHTISVAPLSYKFELVKREQIAATSNFSLNGNQYAKAETTKAQKYPLVSIGDIFELVNGRGFKKEEWRDSGMPIIRIANLNNSSAAYNYYQGGYDDKILIKSDDLLFSWSGTKGTSFGPHVWHGEDGLLNQHIFKLNPKIEINHQFAYRMLKQIVPLIEAKAHGAGGLVHITKSELVKFEIPLPPIEVQNDIIAEVENKQMAIDHAREIIKTLERERERTYFNPSARAAKDGWPILKFSDVATLEYGKSLPLSLRVDGNVPVMGSNGATGYHAESLVSGPGIVIGRKGSAGSVNWIDNDFWPIDTTYYVRPKVDIDLSYLFLVLEASHLDGLKSGAGVPGLNRNDVYDRVEIPLPSRDVQQEVVGEFADEEEIVKANNKLIKILQQKIHKIISAV